MEEAQDHGTFLYNYGHKEVCPHKSFDKAGKLHSGICEAGFRLHVYKDEIYNMVWDIWVAFDSSQSHKEPQSVFPHMNMKWPPSRDKEHRHLCGMAKDIYGCRILASCHKSLGKEGNPHHSSAVCRHAVRNLAPADIFFRKPNLLLQAPTSARLDDDSPTCLHTRPTVAPLRAPMNVAAQHLLARRAARSHIRIARDPPIFLLPARARPPPLKRAIPARARMAPTIAPVLPAVEHPVALSLALETPLRALPLLLRLPAGAAIHPPDLARRAGSLVASLRAAVSPARQRLGTRLVAGEVLLGAAADVLAGSTEAADGDELGARRAGAGVAEEEAVVAAVPAERATADLAAGVGEDPGIRGRVLDLAAKAEVRSRD